MIAEALVNAARHSGAALEDAQDIRSFHGARQERPGHAQDVVPVLGDEVGPDAVAGEAVEGPVVRPFVQSPVPEVLEVDDAGAELVAEQPEEAEDKEAAINPVRASLPSGRTEASD